MSTKSFSHKDYHVGWICALPKERAAAHAMLDGEEHDELPQPDHDHNTYTLGSIGKHNVVIACLPSGEIGTNSAANLVTQMINTFPSIRFGLMVGIGGGIPPLVKLGDVVVSRPSGQFPGVVQWDLGKSETAGFRRTGALDRPPKALLTALAKLEASHDMYGSKIPDYLQAMADRYPKLAEKYIWSPRLKDPMFESHSSPRNPSLGASIIAIMFKFLVALLRLLLGGQESTERNIPTMSDSKSDSGKPRDIDIRYGLIASGNQVVKDGIVRDRINQSLGGEVLCIEMEAAGLMNNFPCIIVRGICDYADAQKNKDWQEYAAAIAAGFTKELLQHVRVADVDSERPVKDILRQVHEDVLATREGVRRIESLMDKDEVNKILDWLTPVSYGQQHTMHSGTHKKGTGQWILESKEFQSWLNNSKQTLLCQGMPGAGKTIITSVIIGHLTAIFKEDTTIGIAYIYCSFKQKTHQTTETLLASVLKQFASCRNPFPDTTKKLYEQHEAKQTQPSQEQLLKDLEAVIGLYSKVFVLIDALDECHLPSMEPFVSTLFELQGQSKMNIFATSRFIPEIKNWFAEAESEFLEIRALASDITTYLEVEMRQSSTNIIRTSPKLQDEIKKEISEAADGMFLLAQIYLNLLQDKLTVKQIRKELQAFRVDAGGGSENEKTKALTHAYDHAIERINEQELGLKNLAMEVLSWITFAKRALTTAELRHGLATKQGMATLEEDDLQHLGDIGRVCVGLVTVDEKSGIIQLVHYTTQEYFEDTQMRWFPDANSALLGACITYLSFTEFESGFCQTDDEFEQRQAKFPLCNYAASHWGEHTPKDIKPGREILEFLKSQAKVDASVQAQLAVKRYSSHTNYSQDVPKRVTALHLAAQFGSPGLTSALLEDKYNPNSPDSDHQTPLLWATRKGHEDVVNLLIDAHANLEVRDKEQSATPLIWAARNGYENIVSLLLQRGADVNARDHSERTPLSLASFYKHKSVVQLLLKSGGVVDANDGAGKVKLLATEVERQAVIEMLYGHDSNLASVEGAHDHEAMIPDTADNWSEIAVQKLLDGDEFLDKVDQYGRTLLSRAAQSGNKEIVQKLIATGKVDINAKDGDHGKTPLIWAARKGHKAIVKLLLEAGADVNVKEQNLGETALTLAIQSGHEESVRALLDKGANVHNRDHSDHTPLFTTTWQGSKAMMQLLLDEGVDVNARDEDGRTPIFNTSAFGSADMVQLLLDSGADIAAIDAEGQTPLFFAAALGQRDVVSLLLKRGIDINSRSKDGRTALFAAIGSGDKDVVNLLLDTGNIDLHNGDDEGTTPIDWAKERGQRDIIQLLHHQLGTTQVIE
ncbi:ankyrin repeat-containing domain protein [Trichoderma ceciliae]